LEKPLGRVVLKERRERGWTQAQLADHAQLSRNQVSLIERGKMAPTIWTIERLAGAFDKRPHQLIKAAEEAVDGKH
jgi:XRE family transcriptional regulator, regulator of sulfur utilization